MSEIVVQKFGGTSVGTVDRIDSVAEIIKSASKSNKIVVNEGILISYKYKNLLCKFLFDDKLLKLKNQSIIHHESGKSIQLFYSGSSNEKLKDIPSLVSIKISYENDIINLNII